MNSQSVKHLTLRMRLIYFFLLQNHDDKLTFEEFLEGSKKDPTIIQALTLYDGSQATIPQN